MKKAILIAATSLFALASAAGFADTTSTTTTAPAKTAQHSKKPAMHKTQAKHTKGQQKSMKKAPAKSDAAK